MDSNLDNPHLARAVRHPEWLEASLPTPTKCRVLVVDDEACIRDVLSIGLRHHGFAVWLATEGYEALDLYRRTCTAIDVVLMDVQMPGLDGPHTLAALQELNPSVRCCFMSGDLGSYTEGELLALGAVAVLHKPFSLAEVSYVLEQLASQTAPPKSSKRALNASIAALWIAEQGTARR
jgi:CheY-like chemotaxis protein